jgi:hypothetical protein
MTNDLVLPGEKTPQQKIEEGRADLALMPNHEQAAKALAILLQSFPHDLPTHPDTYHSQMTTLLLAYPVSVLREMVHPVNGFLAGANYLPKIAELKKWLDARVLDRRNKIAEQWKIIDDNVRRKAIQQERDNWARTPPEERQKLIDRAEALKRTLRSTGEKMKLKSSFKPIQADVLRKRAEEGKSIIAEPGEE